MLARAIEDGLVRPDEITGYESAAIGAGRAAPSHSLPVTTPRQVQPAPRTVS